jgi:hypothetical protein
MRGITTKYLPATDYKGSRIKAHDNGGSWPDRRARSITIGYPHEYSDMDAYAQAALALCKKIEWTRGHYNYTHLVGAWTEQGCVFTFVRIPDGGHAKSFCEDIWELPS